MEAYKTIHILKIKSDFFTDIMEGKKTFELRSTKDRDFGSGDYLLLSENESQRKLLCKINYILFDYDFPKGIQKGFCIMSIEPVALEVE